MATHQTIDLDEGPAMDAELLRHGYERMLVIRRFEEAIQTLFLQGEIHGTVHLYTGQEAVSVGVCMSLTPDDWVSATYRGHGAALAVGTRPEELAAELMGRATGVCGGRAGSMNVVDHQHGLLGCYGIVGGSIASALGAALAGQRSGRVSVAFFGDGATNQGYFHECLNFARVMALPLVLVCENNLYGEFTPMASVTGGGDIAARGAAYGVRGTKVDGNDLSAVFGAASDATARARSGEGPELIEALTYRHLGHSKSDPGAYRPAEEVRAWMERDPLTITRDQLLNELGQPREVVLDIEARAEAVVAAAIEAALAAPFPDPASDAGREYAP